MSTPPFLMFFSSCFESHTWKYLINITGPDQVPRVSPETPRTRLVAWWRYGYRNQMACSRSDRTPQTPTGIIWVTAKTTPPAAVLSPPTIMRRPGTRPRCPPAREPGADVYPTILGCPGGARG